MVSEAPWALTLSQCYKANWMDECDLEEKETAVISALPSPLPGDKAERVTTKLEWQLTYAGYISWARMMPGYFTVGHSSQQPYEQQSLP